MFAGNLWILLKSWLRAGVSYPIRAVARAGEIPVGGVKLFEYPGPEEQCILVRTSEESYIAYSQKCTHLSCAVYYSAPDRRLECPLCARAADPATGPSCAREARTGTGRDSHRRAARGTTKQSAIPRNRNLTAIDGAMALIVLLLIIQMWLLSATLDLFLAGDRDSALAGALISAVLFLSCGCLYLFVVRLERRA